ncbi:hypothetical protein [Mesorhizobium ciceri]|uniref:hypothetical protein n=1 Tax=Mesorhizobium ciceri TaxID=39645 RepID=UPI0013E8A4CF|nr:hypothetical protein [Mesorhizobium ciceri]
MIGLEFLLLDRDAFQDRQIGLPELRDFLQLAKTRIQVCPFVPNLTPGLGRASQPERGSKGIRRIPASEQIIDDPVGAGNRNHSKCEGRTTDEGKPKMSKSSDRTAPGEGKIETGPKTSPQQDPVEGSRETIDRELERTDDEYSSDEAERSRRDVQKKVAEETELPERGSA